MNNLLKNGEKLKYYTKYQPIPCQPVIGGVETMDKKELVKHVSYMVMGDGGVYRNGSQCYFCMNMLSVNLDYMEQCRDILSNITTCTLESRKVYDNQKPQHRLTTLNHPFFTKIRDRVYIDCAGAYKSIDVHALKLLDYEALAYLYMSDGSLTVRNNVPRGVSPEYRVTLNMKRLSYGDQFILKKAIKEKLDIEWNINRDGKYYYLRLRVKDVDKFMSNITPFICSSFKYKLL